MQRLATVVLLTGLSLLVGCTRGDVSRADWQDMTPNEKLLIVESFRGHESARDAKGGAGRLHNRTSEYYRDRIDEIYRAGDQRPVGAIWEGLVEEKPAVSTGE